MLAILVESVQFSGSGLLKRLFICIHAGMICIYKHFIRNTLYIVSFYLTFLLVFCKFNRILFLHLGPFYSI